MANTIKEQQDILAKLNIHALNSMQEEAISAIASNTNTILLSPTGTGKTLAFLLPVIETLDPNSSEVQALILVPSRELAIQIEQVVRNMGSGFKVNAVYGGRPMSKDKIELKHIPAILIGTPGRIADHFANERFAKTHIKTLILDEFDKSLEVGFEYEMRGIINQLNTLNKRILTSATQGVEVPEFIKLDQAKTINYLKKKVASKLEVKTVIAAAKNKSETLVDLILHIGNQPGIVFCNLKDSVEIVSDFLIENNYTSKDHLYAEGGSAGGLLMGAVMNIAPEIYNGIVAEVPFVDVTTTMLDDSIPLTTGEYDEWGNPNEKEYYDYMTSYSPYDQVAIKDYPNLLVTTGLHDSQVQYWEPAKWVAKLRDMKTDTNPLLLYTNMEAGHGGASGRFNALKRYARSYSFLLDLEGVNK